MAVGRRRYQQTAWQAKRDAQKRDTGTPSTTVIQQALYKTHRQFIDVALERQWVNTARSYCVIIDKIRDDLLNQRKRNPDSQDDPDVDKEIPRWATHQIENHLNRAFRYKELKALSKQTKDS
ncbi:hypothetical protein [Ahrensia sp. 13_GOM-1096m]|uniref:hypothetical protein n=1 Tax=Ahrensia sp. 13_GOM-1096m TaxID=1380380 RepID=UPI00047BCC5E|nr:hypothetical protein [Ahrensia sp. 13_GOM-1096m]